MGLEKVPGQPKRHLGSLYSLQKGQNIKKHLEDIDISNGLAWTEDTRTMYYIDSLPRKVYAFDFDINEGTIGTITGVECCDTVVSKHVTSPSALEDRFTSPNSRHTLMKKTCTLLKIVFRELGMLLHSF